MLITRRLNYNKLTNYKLFKSNYIYNLKLFLKNIYLQPKIKN